jgi:cytochrome c5
MRRQAESRPRRALLYPLAVLAALAVLGSPAHAQRKERTGKEVVDAVCGACHVEGKNNAPRIGDTKAWAPRAAQGLTALTDHALNGIRSMPAHGGAPGLSDVEIERAITYMVNQSGGNWVEPIGGATPAVVRTSEGIVNAQCSKCHRTGENGAPKIGNRQDWLPHLKKGMDKLVASAVNGHGPMPARGGLSDLSDDEVRGAIVYMFNYGVPATPPPQPVSQRDPYRMVVAGTDIYLGIMSADRLRASPAVGVTPSSSPEGKGYYHLNIALADDKSQVPVTDARVKLRVSDGMTMQTKNLELVAANNTVSYGAFFRLSSGNSYNITAEVQRAGETRPIRATFEFRAP